MPSSNVTVKYLGIFSQITQKKSEKIVLEQRKTVGVLVNKLCLKYGGEFKKRIKEDIGYRNVTFIVNGIVKDLDASLCNGDEVVIAYPVGGRIGMGSNHIRDKL